MQKTLLIIGSIIALSGVAYWALYVMGHIEGVQLSGHGIAAMAIGLFFTIVIGFGLMALIFFSNKHGHDDRVHELYKTMNESNDDKTE